MLLPVPVFQHNPSSNRRLRGPYYPRWRHKPGPPKIRAMKVTVDSVSCEANAICAGLVPQVFSIREDDDGEDVLTIANDGEVSAELADDVRDAVDRCPKMALIFHE
jgi:ferredoxin